MGYDASLGMIAVGLYLRTTTEGLGQLVGFTFMKLPFPETSDSSYQNTVEFLAVLLGVLLAMHMGYRHRGVELHGDSWSSLQWALKDRVVSVLARRANIAYTLAASNSDITIESVHHMKGKVNVTWDGASRGEKAEKLGLAPELQIHFGLEHPISQIIGLCNPQEPLVSTADHTAISMQIIRHLHSPLMQTYSPPPSASLPRNVRFSEETTGGCHETDEEKRDSGVGQRL
jgi:hypothetical protein